MQFFYGHKHADKCAVILAMILVLLATIVIVDERNRELVHTGAVACYEKRIAITFDDGPGYKTTMKLLDGLRERNVKATFFLLGEQINERKCVVEQMAKDGHLIGNHTYSHIQLDEVNYDVVVAEIEMTNKLIKEIAGVEVCYIRPPYGIWNNEIAKRISMKPVLWTVDSSDWNTKDISKVVEHVVAEAEDGDIILMHDIYETSVVAALEIIDRLESKGFEFVTVDELLIE